MEHGRGIARLFGQLREVIRELTSKLRPNSRVARHDRTAALGAWDSPAGRLTSPSTQARCREYPENPPSNGRRGEASALKLIPVSPTLFRKAEHRVGAYHEGGEWIHHASPREFAVGLDVLWSNLDVLAVRAAAEKLPSPSGQSGGFRYALHALSGPRVA